MDPLSSIYSLALNLKGEVIATAPRNPQLSAELMAHFQPIGQAITNILENRAEYNAGILEGFKRSKDAFDKFMVNA